MRGREEEALRAGEGGVVALGDGGERGRVAHYP
jgi:hypothetical protein